MERPIFLGPGFKEALPIADFQFPIGLALELSYFEVVASRKVRLRDFGRDQ